MTAPDTTASVPDPVHADAVAAHELAYPRQAEDHHFDRAERILRAVAAAGFSIAPGPVPEPTPDGAS